MVAEPRPRSGLRAAGIAVLVAAFVVLVATVVPVLLLPDDHTLGPPDLIKARNDVRSSLLGALGGLGALAALYFTWSQLGLSRLQARQSADNFADQQANERLAKATEMLGHQSESVRIAGISNLELLARERPEKREIIAQILVSLVRQLVPLGDERPGPDGPSLASRSPSAEWALVALGRTVVVGAWPKRLRLNSLDLTGANLEGLSLVHADLAHSCLDEAYLRDADLTDAWMPHASLRRANFRDATVTGAVVRGADLTGSSGLDADSVALMRGDGSTVWPDTSAADRAGA